MMWWVRNAADYWQPDAAGYRNTGRLSGCQTSDRWLSQAQTCIHGFFAGMLAE
jgi:hypothetical protein